MSLVSKLLSLGFAGWFAVSQVLFGVSAAAAGTSSYAQADIIDVEPPLIEHSVNGAVEATTRQSFVASVVDDDELDRVSLYYRFKGDPAYSTLQMERVSFSSTYIVHIPTDAADARSIEYYIQARDKAGNRTVRGYAFNPLLREINAPTVAAEPSPPPASPSLFESIGKEKTVLYVVLGVLAVGAIASAVDSGSKPPACPNDLCTVTVNVGEP